MVRRSPEQPVQAESAGGPGVPRPACRSLRSWAALGLAGVTGFAVAVIPALAADPTVHATDALTFTPRTVTVAVGGTVTWVNDGGVHNVHFDGEAKGTPSTASKTWSTPVTRTFPTTGTYRYYCDPHEGADMVGYVAVEASGSTTTTTTGATTTTTGPSTQPTSTTPGTSTPRTVLSARTRGSRFCARRSAACQRPGARLRLTVDPAQTRALITGTLQRRAPGATTYRRFGTIRLSLDRGIHDITIRRTRTGRVLQAGRYRLVLAERFLAKSITVRFRLRGS